jgi:hypothetical protein
MMESESAHGTLLKLSISLPVLRHRAKELLWKRTEKESGGVVELLLRRRRRKRAEQQVEDSTPALWWRGAQL